MKTILCDKYRCPTGRVFPNGFTVTDGHIVSSSGAVWDDKIPDGAMMIEVGDDIYRVVHETGGAGLMLDDNGRLAKAPTKEPPADAPKKRGRPKGSKNKVRR